MDNGVCVCIQHYMITVAGVKKVICVRSLSVTPAIA